jgi:outer membrane protein assembly factor BamB
MYGFDRATGTKLFFNSGTQTDNWGPAAWGGLVYITDGSVKGITPTDGKVATQISDSRVQAVSTPVIGSNNDLLTITGNRLVSVDLLGKKVAWEQSGSYTGMPVVGGNVVYGFSGPVVAARNEADGALLWSWTPPAPYTQMQSMVLTNNVLFVSASAGYSPGATFAIDLTSHLTVWSYPMSGHMALSSQGVLYIVQGSKVAAISVR